MSEMFIPKQAYSKNIRRICEKLGIPGGEALALYVEFIKMSGQVDKITE
jgi:hypothetical protein